MINEAWDALKEHYWAARDVGLDEKEIDKIVRRMDHFEYGPGRLVDGVWVPDPMEEV